MTRRSSSFTSLLATSFVVATVACSSTTPGSSNGGGGTTSTSKAATDPVSRDECQTRCTKRARQCDATPDQVDEICGDVCGGSLDEAQLDCLEEKPCVELASGRPFAELCPAGGADGASGGGESGAAFGEACTCAGASSTGSGLCSSDNGCAGGLVCKYDSGSGGKGTCIGGPCCTKTSACDEDSSLLASCKQGTCTKTNMGYFCMP